MPTMPIGTKFCSIRNTVSLPSVGRRAHEFDGVLLRIGMRQAAGVFRNAAIVGETRDCFYVRERRPAQRQPFGLEDARTGLAQTRGRNILQHVGLHRSRVN